VEKINIEIDAETYRMARIRAAELNTSVSAMVKRFLADFAIGGATRDQLKERERQIRETITSFSAGDRLSRDEVHHR
jgi:hypothetical protein